MPRISYKDRIKNTNVNREGFFNNMYAEKKCVGG